ALRYRPEGRSLISIALYGLILLRTGDSWQSNRGFRDLRSDAERRRQQDQDDFSAYDLEGFAVCGQHVCGQHVGADTPLLPAFAAFRQARERSQPAGLIARFVRLIEELEEGGRPRLLVAVAEAASGAVSRA